MFFTAESRKAETAFSANFIGTTNLFKAKRISENSLEINGSTLECKENIKDDLLTITIRPEDIKISQNDNEKNILKGTIKELEFLGSNIRGHIAVDFKSEKANIICNFASEYILNNNILNFAKYIIFIYKSTKEKIFYLENPLLIF